MAFKAVFPGQEPLELGTREAVHALAAGFYVGKGMTIEAATGTASAMLDEIREEGRALDGWGLHVIFEDHPARQVTARDYLD